jgi:hypothetical protein
MHQSNNLHNIVNQENMQCSNDTAYNILSQTNSGYYLINEDNRKACDCTYIDAKSENVECPAGQSVSTYYPLLNKAECCAPCPVKQITNNNIPSNYDHVHNNLYPLYSHMQYDFATFYDNPRFMDYQVAKQEEAKKEEIVIGTPIKSNEELEHFENKDPVIIEPNDQSPIVSASVMVINLNYVIMFCILLLGIFTGIIICRKKYIM